MEDLFDTVTLPQETAEEAPRMAVEQRTAPGGYLALVVVGALLSVGSGTFLIANELSRLGLLPW